MVHDIPQAKVLHLVRLFTWETREICEKRKTEQTEPSEHMFCFYLFLPPARRLCFLPYLFVGLSVCQQDYAKSTNVSCSELGGEMGHGPEKNPLHFVVGLVKGADPLSLTFQDRA